MTAPLALKNLSVAFRQKDGDQASDKRVVNGVSFDLHRGETVAVVGESGSGKSITALSILQLLPYPQAYHPSGSITYNGVELMGATENELHAIRGNDISMIFQEPMTALNPLHRVERQINESLKLHQGMNEAQARLRTIDLLERVGIRNPESRLSAFPHELSGGQRQRVMIAMALANKPEILLADEPTTALDVTVQAKVLALLKEIQRQDDLGILFITHDLGLVEKFADRVLVMNDGNIVERGATEQIFTAPKEAYTKMLIESAPPERLRPEADSKTVLVGNDIRVWFPIKKGVFQRTVDHVKALNDADISVQAGHTLGVVGESGSGKSTLAYALMGLVPSEGTIVFDGHPFESMNKSKWRQVRRDLQIVFQDPYGALSPRLTIGDIIAEGLDAHKAVEDKNEREERIIAAMGEVDLNPEFRYRYPHEFSGGQRQRVAIARALILEPKVLILDEPTSALDRSVQRTVLELLNDVQRRHNLAYIFISHDLSVIRAMCDEVIVLYQGDVVERGPSEQIFNHPQMPYTQQLLRAAQERILSDA